MNSKQRIARKLLILFWIICLGERIFRSTVTGATVKGT